MSLGAARLSAGVLPLFFATASACNGQFDFDTDRIDAGQPPIIITEGGADDIASTGDPVFEAPRIGVSIACGATDCLSTGCCSRANGTECVDIVDGGVCSGLLIQCDDSEDCPAGQVCCAEVDDHTSADCPNASGCEADPPERVHCEPESHCRALKYVILCNPDRPGLCTCISTTLPGLPPGYHQCVAAP